MTTARTHITNIVKIENFEIEVYDNHSEPIDVNQNGLLNSWPHVRRTRGSKNVNHWKAKFAALYPGYSARVLKDDGTEAHGGMLLSTVRETYEEE